MNKKLLLELTQRRQKFLQAMGPNSIAILGAAPHYIRTGDSTHLYRQNSDFYYLTGFPEAEAIAVFIPGRKEGEYILFSRALDPNTAIWTGELIGQKNASAQYGAAQAFAMTEVDDMLPQLLANCQRVFFAIGRDANFDQRLTKWLNDVRKQVRSGTNAPKEFINSEKITHEMRLKKSELELAIMRTAAKISALAHCRAMRACKPKMMEYELEAELEYEFKRHGSQNPAYTSIVGGGANACVLHYTDNNQQLKDGELVLIDAGAEYDYYAADITRTFPINGKFNVAQRAIYELVLKAQVAAIEAVRPQVTWNQPHQVAIQIITAGLVKLGLLQGEVEELIANKSYTKFFMHRTSHWLGLDTHDAGDYRTGNDWRTLEPGMVLTIEPGIYIRPDEKIATKWWNIGVRIEDDVLVTASGHEVLTSDVPKDIAAIEALVGKGNN